MSRIVIRRGEVQPTPRNMVEPVVRPYNTTFSTLKIGDVFIAAENLQLGAYSRLYKHSISDAILVFSLDYRTRYGDRFSLLGFGGNDPVVALPDKCADTDQPFADIRSGDVFYSLPPSIDTRTLMRKNDDSSFYHFGDREFVTLTHCANDRLVYLR